MSCGGVRCGPLLFLVIALAGCSSSEGIAPSTVTDGGAAPDPAPPREQTGPAAADAGSSKDAGAEDALRSCDRPQVGGPASAPYSFTFGGQTAWSHDDGFAAGYFHTYDALDVSPGSEAAHKVHVLLPRGYAPCDGGYPVVYMNDGQTTFWTGGAVAKSWRVAEALDALYREGAVPRVIVVAIVPNDRDYEYSYASAGPGKSCCGADPYTTYLADHLKPFIDANYRTRSGRDDTAIIGSSRGGLSAFYVATRRPGVFGKAGCLSPSFWAGLDPVYGGALAGGALADSGLVAPVKGTLADAAKRPRLWIDWGLLRTGGFANDTIEAAATPAWQGDGHHPSGDVWLCGPDGSRLGRGSHGRA